LSIQRKLAHGTAAESAKRSFETKGRLRAVIAHAEAEEHQELPAAAGDLDAQQVGEMVAPYLCPSELAPPERRTP
jgi:hypothetical protein